MATTKIWAIKGRIDKVISYAENKQKTTYGKSDTENLRDVMDYAMRDYKTEQQLFVSGVNCGILTARTEMTAVKEKYGKTDKILAFHGYQSFKPDEVGCSPEQDSQNLTRVTPEMCHVIGVKLAQELWGDHFQVIVATHLDKNHLHNHFVVNSVSCVDGHKFHACKASYNQMREVSDRLCREYRLSVVENPVYGKTKHHAEYKAELDNKPTWRSLIRADIDRAIESSMTTKQFWSVIEKMGYEVKNGIKYLAIKPQGKERFYRLYKLGDGYDIEQIKERILSNQRLRPQLLDEPVRRKVIANRPPHKKLKGLRALYYYYLYRIGGLQNRTKPKRVPLLLRDDVVKLDKIIAESTLLRTHKIDTSEQLVAYKTSIISKMGGLVCKRKELRKQLRTTTDTDLISNIKLQISEISDKLKPLRKEVVLCDGIVERSINMRKNIDTLLIEENQNGKEEKQYEQFRRSNRPNR